MTPEHLVAYAEGLSRIAAAGGGPKAFAAHLAAELGVTVLVEDADGRHLATAGNAASAPASIREAGSNGHAARAIPVMVGESLLGHLAVFGKAVDERDYALRLTASAIGVELAREQGGRHGRSRTFWERLIEGAYHDLASARDDALTRGISLAAEYVAVVLELEVSDEASAAGGAVDLRRIAADAFRTPDAEPAILENAGALTLLIPAPREVDGANIRTAASLFARTLAKKSAHARVSGGVGERVPALAAGKSVEQAGNAMIIARRIFGAGRVAAYDDLGIYPLLYSGPSSEALAAFARRTLEPLRAYDEKHQTELERTLRLYFAVGENVKTAAAELNVHRHTVFYRLRQIAEICGCKLESPHDQLTLRLAIAIDALIQ